MGKKKIYFIFLQKCMPMRNSKQYIFKETGKNKSLSQLLPHYIYLLKLSSIRFVISNKCVQIFFPVSLQSVTG